MCLHILRHPVSNDSSLRMPQTAMRSNIYVGTGVLNKKKNIKPNSHRMFVSERTCVCVYLQGQTVYYTLSIPKLRSGKIIKTRTQSTRGNPSMSKQISVYRLFLFYIYIYSIFAIHTNSNRVHDCRCFFIPDLTLGPRDPPRTQTRSSDCAISV